MPAYSILRRIEEGWKDSVIDKIVVCRSIFQIKALLFSRFLYGYSLSIRDANREPNLNGKPLNKL